MAAGFDRRFRRPTRRFGLLAAFLALWCQLALGPAAVAAELAMQGLPDDAGVICRSHAAGGTEHAPQHHDTPCCVLCALAASQAAPGFGPAPGPVLRTPTPPLVLRPEAPPQARAPPARALVAAFPRGPPHLLA